MANSDEVTKRYPTRQGAKARLTVGSISTLNEPGRYLDANGLYLLVAKGGSKSWLFRYKRDGRLRDMGLGSINAVSLTEARIKAAEVRGILARGGDPIDQKRAAEAGQKAEAAALAGIPSFGAFADELVADIEDGFRNDKHIAQWRMTLGDAYCASIRGKLISEISTADVLAILRPIWLTKHETASRLRGRIERIFDAAKAKGLRSGENPARLKGNLDALLPKRRKIEQQHHAAMPYSEVPAFLRRLRKVEGMSAMALEFAILTAARSGEALGATWSEIHILDKLWTVPATRMKAGKEHRVPLSDRAVEILEALLERRGGDEVVREGEVSDEFIFFGRHPTKSLSIMSMAMCLRRLKKDAPTVHGFRSAFRDWVAEETNFQREIAEEALAHVVGDSVERAYRRGDALEKRRALMEAWEAYLQRK